MNSLVAKMMGKPIQEDDSVPLPASRQVGSDRDRSRGRRRNPINNVSARTTAAMMMGEAAPEEDDSIIPDNAEEIDNIAGPSGIRMDDKGLKRDREPNEPDSPTVVEDPAVGDDKLLSPRDALVAPDLTPHAMEPIDASEVPEAPHQEEKPNVPRFVKPQPTGPNNTVDPMDVLLGRRSSPQAKEVPPEPVVTAEAAQATVNAALGVTGGPASLNENVPMPDHKQGDGKKIMETFYRFGPKPKWNF